MLPAGKYYIGDLRYVMSAEWEEVCALATSGQSWLEGEFKLADGRQFALYETSWSDGLYSTSSGDWVWVESGTVGCIRIEDVRDTGHPGHLPMALERLGYEVEFGVPFATGKDPDGTIFFGSERVSPDGEDLPPYGAD